MFLSYMPYEYGSPKGHKTAIYVYNKQHQNITPSEGRFQCDCVHDLSYSTTAISVTVKVNI